MFRRKKNFWEKKLADKNFEKKYITKLEMLAWGLIKGKYWKLDDVITEITLDLLNTEKVEWNEFAKDWNKKEIKMKIFEE
tara:strand:+ start:702 stop:941 length:240 start_codon:yes stop_codon:yes gene_type:complete